MHGPDASKLSNLGDNSQRHSFPALDEAPTLLFGLSQKEAEEVLHHRSLYPLASMFASLQLATLLLRAGAQKVR